MIDMDKTLHITDLDHLHIYMVAQILSISEHEAQQLYDDYCNEEVEDERAD